jgi:uncharacterized protein
MMKNRTPKIHTTIRLYGDLTAIIPGNRHRSIIDRKIPEPTSVKDLIEACGVPHTEIDLILVDSHPVDFSFLINKDTQISVYPVFYELDIPENVRLQKRSISIPRFLADVNLGKLARYLRMAGFDTAYSNNVDDDDLILQMQNEKRVLLTRDHKLLMHNAVKTGFWPRSDHPAEQFKEVVTRFDLFDEVNPFSRCINCNGVLKNVSKKDVIDQLEPLTRKHFNRFSQCPDCEQIYWAGSHRDRLDPILQKIFNQQGAD